MIFADRKLAHIIWFVIILGSGSFAQNSLHDQFMYAMSFYNQEKYFDAITEFKRLQFFDSLKQYSFTTNKLIAMCYKYGGKFDDAIKYFSKAEYHASNVDSILLIKVEMIKVNLLRGTTFRAFDLLNTIEQDERFKDKNAEIIYWKGWAYIFNAEWEKASKEFVKIDSNHELKLLCENVSESHYSKTTAKVLSFILPGAGQFYTGNFLSGIMSLGWVSLWTYLSIQAFTADRIFDGLITADLLALRFYNGNLQNAEKFAENHNDEISNWMLNYLQNNYRGEKP